MSYSILEKTTYTLYLSSNDRISGTHNNGNYIIDWNDFLPPKWNTYKMIWCGGTTGGYYKDSATVSNITLTTTSVATTTAVTSTANYYTYSTGSIPIGTTLLYMTGLNDKIYIGALVTGTGIVTGSVITAFSIPMGYISISIPTSATIPATTALTFQLMDTITVNSATGMTVGMLLSTTDLTTAAGIIAGYNDISVGNTILTITGTTIRLSLPVLIALPTSTNIYFNGPSSVIVVNSVTGLYVGMLVSGYGIPARTYIVSISALNITLSNPVLIAFNNSDPNLTFYGNVYSTGKIYMNFGSKSYSFDTTSNSPSQCIGYINRDPQSTSSSSNVLNAFYSMNPPKTINRTTSNLINISVYNGQLPNLLLYNTDTAGNALNDCTPLNLIFEFLPVDESEVAKQNL